jgi:hypothetical protein
MEGGSRKEMVAMGLKHWWKTGAAPNDYEFGLAHETFEGQPVAYLRSIVRPVRSFAAFCQTIAAEDYRGKRIRFSAALKANAIPHFAEPHHLTRRSGGRLLPRSSTRPATQHEPCTCGARLGLPPLGPRHPSVIVALLLAQAGGDL